MNSKSKFLFKRVTKTSFSSIYCDAHAGEQILTHEYSGQVYQTVGEVD
jgi:hypothetical protein